MTVKNMLKYYIWLGVLCFAVCRVVAENSKPIAAIEFTCKSTRGPAPEELALAERQLKLKIFEIFLASLSDVRRELIRPHVAKRNGNHDDLFSQFNIRTKEFDKNKKILTLSAEGQIDLPKINSMIDLSSTPAEKNPVVFVFVARRQVEVETRDAKVITGTQKSSSKSKEVESQSKPNKTVIDESEVSKNLITSIGVTTRTADRIIYALEDNLKAGVDRAITKVLVDRGFDTVPAAALVEVSKGIFNPDELQKDFETSSQFSQKNQVLATRVCREAGAPMLAYGTLTLGVKRPDPVNSQQVIVNVIVDAQILDCRKPLPIKVGSIGPLQIEGVGSDQTQAELVGLDLAATKAAQHLADQLRNRGIR